MNNSQHLSSLKAVGRARKQPQQPKQLLKIKSGPEQLGDTSLKGSLTSNVYTCRDATTWNISKARTASGSTLRLERLAALGVREATCQQRTVSCKAHSKTMYII